MAHSEKINNELMRLFAVADIINDRLYDSEEACSFAKLNIKDVVDNVLNEYKFSNLDKNLVQFECNNNFPILVNKNSFAHVLCHLLRSALYSIRFIKKGEIIITADEENDCNVLLFKNTISDVDSQMRDSIFDLVMPKKFCGTNLGLYFCKKVMNAMNVEVLCTLKDTQHIEFVFKFPKI